MKGRDRVNRGVEEGCDEKSRVGGLCGGGGGVGRGGRGGGGAGGGEGGGGGGGGRRGSKTSLLAGLHSHLRSKQELCFRTS